MPAAPSRFMKEFLSVFLRHSSRATKHLAEADRARDKKNWQLAAVEYGKSLHILPNQPPIWIQLGHARKELGDLRGSEAAYQKALDFSPRNSDGALHMGHVLKLQGRGPEALNWYKNALIFEPRNREAARELRDLGVDADTVLAAATRAASLEHPWGQCGNDAAVLIDVTTAWDATTAGDPMEWDVVWLFRIGLAFQKANSDVRFCVRKNEEASYAILSDDALRWLGDAVLCNAKAAAPPAPLHPLPDIEKVLLLTLPPFGAEVSRWVASIQDLRLQCQLAIVAVLPTLHFLRCSHLYRTSERNLTRERSLWLLEQASVVLTTSDDDAHCVRALCRNFGHERRLIMLNRPRRTASARTASGSDSPGLRFAVLAPRSKSELDSVLRAWHSAPAGKTLSLVATNSASDSINDLRQSVLDAGIASTAFEIVPPDSKAVKGLLRDSRSLLVPDSRPDGLLWIEEALDLGVPSIAGQSSLIFRWFMGDVEDYCDFKDVDQLVARWISRPLGGHPKARLELPSIQGTESTDIIESLRGLALPEFAVRAPAINIATFYSFARGAEPRSAIGGNGQRLLAGTNWQPPSPYGVAAEGAGRLRFFIHEIFYDRLRFACLVAGSPNASVDVSSYPINQKCMTAWSWRVPKEGWGWLSGEFAGRGESGIEIRIAVQPATSQTEGDELPIIVGGLFVYPATVDRYWFEFLDQASRDLLAFPIRFTRRFSSLRTKGLASEALVPPGIQ